MTLLFYYASTQQWNLAYSDEEDVRAIAGKSLAHSIYVSLKDIVDGKEDAPRMNVQFGTYSTFMSFFGLAQLHHVDTMFTGICDYASSMAFELITNATSPSADDISVRFLFSDGTAADSGLEVFPLDGENSTVTPWDGFEKFMVGIALHDDDHWDEICEPPSNSTHRGDEEYGYSTRQPPMSNAMAGAFGAVSTIAALSTVIAVVMFIGGYRAVTKSRLEDLKKLAGVTKGVPLRS